MATDFAQQYPNPYDYLRQKAKQESDIAKQEQEDALKRRFAQMGTLQSGASLKVQQQATEQANKQAQDVQSQIGFQEAQTNLQQQEAEKQRQFQTSERVGTQLFQKQLVDEDRAFKSKYADLDNAFREKEFSLNTRATALNAAVALKNAGFSPDEVSGINEVLRRLGISFDFGDESGSGVRPPPEPTKQSGGTYDEKFNSDINPFYSGITKNKNFKDAGAARQAAGQMFDFYNSLNEKGRDALRKWWAQSGSSSPIGFNQADYQRWLQQNPWVTFINL